ncbi:hypothetical protein OBBRIDRAFT_714804, partial [Obba rivulosa]
IRWVPGHMDIRGNELADAEAKKAATGLSSDPMRLPKFLRTALPASSSRIKQTFAAKLKDRARIAWTNSTRSARMRATDPTLPSTSFEKL